MKESNKEINKINNLNIKINVKNEDSCPLYCLREIQKINNKEEIPGWLKERLSKRRDRFNKPGS